MAERITRAQMRRRDRSPSRLPLADRNLRTAIEALGAKPDHVAKLTAFVVDHDISKLEVLTKNVKAMFGGMLPAQTLIPVPKLAIDPMLFEVEAIVVLQ